MELEEQVKQLNKLRGVMLLDTLGHIYLIKDFAYKRSEPRLVKGGWFKSDEWQLLSYVNEIRFNYGNQEFDYNDTFKVQSKINECIRDRARYLNLQRTLREINCRIISNREHTC